jgi:hypothetical protein
MTQAIYINCGEFIRRIKMNNVITFPKKMKTLREKIYDGKITDDIRTHLLNELDDLEKYHPNSWDKRFAQDMIKYRKNLTDSQIKQLERILQNPIDEEEYPDDIEL